MKEGSHFLIGNKLDSAVLCGHRHFLAHSGGGGTHAPVHAGHLQRLNGDGWRGMNTKIMHKVQEVCLFVCFQFGRKRQKSSRVRFGLTKGMRRRAWERWIGVEIDNMKCSVVDG